MEWLTAVAAAIAVPLTAVSALWPVIRDRSRLTQLERIASLVDIPSLSNAERLRLSAYRRRLARRVFVRTMLPRQWFDLIAGLYGVVMTPVLLVVAIVMFIAGNGRTQDAWVALLTAVVAFAFGFGVLERRGRRMRQRARLVLSLYRSPIEPVGPVRLRKLLERSDDSKLDLTRGDPMAVRPDGFDIAASPS